ncbi:MAG: hypothetical protein P1U65_04300 [Minwuia sp.]|nr:hypothetical protein [Minwuia sp.]
MNWVEWSEIARNLAIVAGGGFGLWLAWSRTRALGRQTETSELAEVQRQREHVAQLFDSSLERLNHEQHWVRLGAVFVLEQITETAPELSDSVVSVLVAYFSSEMETISAESDELDAMTLGTRPDLVEIQRFLVSTAAEAR